MKKSIGIIGGGISGLTAAFLLKKRGFDVTVFERSERVGGNLQTIEIDGFLIEYAANSLLKSPRLVDLVKELDLESEVLPADPSNKKRYVLLSGKLASLPISVGKMVFGNFFSRKGKLRLLKEPFIRSKSPENESVAAFFERRLGREIVEKAADPFISGIYAGDPEKLSIRAAFPRLFELERDYGSLLIGSLRSKSESAPKEFPRTFSFKRGVQTLTDRLAKNLGKCITTETEVLKIEREADGKWNVETRAGENEFDAVVISTSAKAASRLVRDLDAGLSVQLESIYYPPVAMVFFGVKRENIGKDLDGFGFLVPGSESRNILGTIWNSSVFPNRAPEGFHLLTTFVGGARNASVFEKTDEELIELVQEELKEILGLREGPDFAHVKRWPKAIPQYNIGHEAVEKAVADFEAAHRGFYFCSNFYKGISVGDCVKNAFKVAGVLSHELHE